jgi:predicted ATPase/transcriptional regulator with XRE-family HTH domain
VAFQPKGSPAEAGGSEFGSMLRRHRRAAGLSQEDLADRAGLSVDAIAALERGRRRAPRPLTARLLAKALALDEAARATFLSSAAGASVDAATVWSPPPVPTTELVGRTGELADAMLRLTESPTRLLTLTGPGGIGKTRLAVALAAACAERLAASASWVSLEPLVEGSSVAATVAASIGLRPMPGQDPLDPIAAAVGQRPVLLVLDNCEHVVGDAATLVATLLSRCPQLHVLVTSRERLGVPGEAVQIVDPLSIPPEDCPAELLVGSPAVRLFLARAVERGVRTGDRQLPEVARIVRRLDGIPLAIELATARLNVLTIAQIADELDESLQILRVDDRIGPRRHRTMRRAVAWSFDLLDERDRHCLAALSIFVGGWTREAAEAVCEGLLDTDPATPGDEPDLIDLMGRLADRSLLLVRRSGPTARYDAMAAIRDYAFHQLGEFGLSDTVARRHAAYFADFAESAEAELRGPAQADVLNRLSVELDNLRAAIRWSVDRGEVDLALRLAGASWTFCYLRGHYSEGREWLEAALGMGAGGSWQARANAMLGAGMLAFLQCEYDLATERIESALREYRTHRDRTGTALCLQRLGSVARERADYDRAAELLRQSRQLSAELDDRSGLAWADHYLGFVSWLRGDLDEAESRCGAAQAVFRDLGDGEGIAWSLISLGVVALYRGDLDLAEAKLSECLGLSQRMGYREGAAWSLNQLGVVELRRGRTERAVHLLDESLAEHRDLGDRWRMASVTEALADVARVRGRADYAAYLLGASDAVRTQIGAPIPDCEAPAREACLAAIRSTLDPDTFEAARAAGAKTPLYAVAEGYPASLGES